MQASKGCGSSKAGDGMEQIKRVGNCAVCGGKLDEMSVQLQQQGHRALFCSMECVVTYAVTMIRQRLEKRNSQVRVFAREQKKLSGARHSKRGGRSTVA
jgi:hypothetical protein